MAITLYISDRFRNRKIEFFNEFSFSLSYDSIASTFGFKCYFDPFNVEHKEAFCVTHYHEVTIFDDDKPFLKGVIVKQNFSDGPKKTMAEFTGYSLPGILEDVTIPPSIFPLQSDGVSLAEIARKLIAPFKRNYGLEMIIDPSVSDRMNKSFKSTTASATQKIKDYLSTLASQKNIIMSHDVQGRLLFTEAKTKQLPIWTIDLTKPMPVGVNYSMEFDGQNMHSHITVMKQSSIDGGNAGEYTLRNPYVIGSVYRPITIEQSSGDDNDTSLAARRALGDELRNVKLTITIDRWTLDSQFILPNSIISMYAPSLYLYHKADWFIESVEYTGNSDSQTAVLNCVLPEVYNEDKVVSIFRDINLHALGE